MKKQPWSIRTSRFLTLTGRPASSLAGAVALRATGPKITILVFPAVLGPLRTSGQTASLH